MSMAINELIYTLQCDMGRTINRPLRLRIADMLSSMWDENRSLQFDNNQLRTTLAYMKESQVTHHCENCETSAKKLEELQKQLEAAVSNIPKVCATCKHDDHDGSAVSREWCIQCYFHDQLAWEWNGQANIIQEGND